jgi:hypothetical protein
MNALAFTMVYNDSVNLPIWLEYYGRNFGPENLLILDHGSTDGSTRDLALYNHMRIPRDEFNEGVRCKLVNSIQQGLQPYYDMILFSDCDEIIVPDPHKYSSLLDYLDYFVASDMLSVSPLGLNVVHMPEIEPDFVPGKPVLDQRKYVWFSSHYCKPLLVKVPVTWNLGFHGCTGCHCAVRPHVDSDLYLFHLKNIDKAASLKRLEITRNMKWAGFDINTNIGEHQRFDDARYIDFFLTVTQTA